MLVELALVTVTVLTTVFGVVASAVVARRAGNRMVRVTILAVAWWPLGVVWYVGSRVVGWSLRGSLGNAFLGYTVQGVYDW